MEKIAIPKTVYALCVAFAYGLLAYFWPAVPFDQETFSLVIVAILGGVGVEVSTEVKALRAVMKSRNLL